MESSDIAVRTGVGVDRERAREALDESARWLVIRITHAQFELNFDEFLEIALKQPVQVAEPGEDEVVIIASEYFERLVALDKREATEEDKELSATK